MGAKINNEAYFAGRLFMRGRQDEYEYLMWCVPPDIHNHQEMQITTSVAEPLQNAFVCKLKNGWIFVCGTTEYSPVRHTFLDDSENAERNAMSLKAIGVPELPIEEGNSQVREIGAQLYSVTGDEKQRLRSAEDYKKRMEQK